MKRPANPRFFPLCLTFCLLLLSGGAEAWGVSAINCHCFQERTFDPARPKAADPYLLATTRNTFLSAVFSLEKRSVVRARMTGTPAEDLWLTHWISARTGQSPSGALEMRSRHDNWAAALTSVAPATATFPASIRDAVEKGLSDRALTALVVDETLAARLGAGRSDLEELRSAGANDQETIFSVFLARHSDQPPVEYFTAVTREGRSWGELMHQLGIAAGEIEQRLRTLVDKDR